jgi:urease accessory protein
MLTVERIVAAPTPAQRDGRQRDCVRMTSEERRWVRRRIISAGGREIALALPTGSVIQPGDVLVNEPEWYLEVEASEEPVLAIRPRDHRAALRVAFEVGNHHFPIAIDGDTLLVPDDTAMEQLLTRLGEPWERRRAVFEPIAKAHRH